MVPVSPSRSVMRCLAERGKPKKSVFVVVGDVEAPWDPVPDEVNACDGVAETLPPGVMA